MSPFCPLVICSFCAIMGVKGGAFMEKDTRLIHLIASINSKIKSLSVEIDTFLQILAQDENTKKYGENISPEDYE